MFGQVFRRVGKRSAHAARNILYHRRHRRQALTILKTIRRRDGLTLSDNHRKECDDYAASVFGSQKYAPWLHVYTAMAQEFREGWIPDNYYGEVIVPKLKGDYGEISSLKPLNQVLFRSEAFPDIASHVNGIVFTRDYRPIEQDLIRDTLFAECDRIVFKADNSLQGRGIFFFTRESFDMLAVKRIGNGLFQRAITQHNDLGVFSDNTTATLRLTTVFDGGGISLRAAYLRMGRDVETHVQSRSHIRVPVNTKTGALDEIGHSSDWARISAHPDSHEPFQNRKIPAFDECVRTVLSLHHAVPFARVIGWDMTVDIEGTPRVIEWNGAHNDIKYSEATQGPCFADLISETKGLQAPR